MKNRVIHTLRHRYNKLEHYSDEQYFLSLKDVRSWLLNHARLQQDIGHEIDLRASNTEGLADYFDFEIRKLKQNKQTKQ